MRDVSRFAVRTETALRFEDAIGRVKELLKGEGFGILIDHDVQATMKEKIGIDFKPYRLLEACDPGFAHQTLEVEPCLGVFFPINVVIWDEGDRRVVAALEPRFMSELVGGVGIDDISAEVSARLHRVIEGMSEPAG